MIVIKFLGLMALGMFLVFLILVIKNAIDAEMNRHFIIKNVKRHITESLYMVIKANEQMKKDLIALGFDPEDYEDMVKYLRDTPRSELEQGWEEIAGEKFPLDLSDILGDEDGRDGR